MLLLLHVVVVVVVVVVVEKILLYVYTFVSLRFNEEKCQLLQQQRKIVMHGNNRHTKNIYTPAWTILLDYYIIVMIDNDALNNSC